MHSLTFSQWRDLRMGVDCIHTYIVMHNAADVVGWLVTWMYCARGVSQKWWWWWRWWCMWRWIADMNDWWYVLQLLRRTRSVQRLVVWTFVRKMITSIFVASWAGVHGTRCTASSLNHKDPALRRWHQHKSTSIMSNLLFSYVFTGGIMWCVSNAAVLTLLLSSRRIEAVAWVNFGIFTGWHKNDAMFGCSHL